MSEMWSWMLSPCSVVTRISWTRLWTDLKNHYSGETFLGIVKICIIKFQRGWGGGCPRPVLPAVGLWGCWPRPGLSSGPGRAAPPPDSATPWPPAPHPGPGPALLRGIRGHQGGHQHAEVTSNTAFKYYSVKWWMWIATLQWRIHWIHLTLLDKLNWNYREKDIFQAWPLRHHHLDGWDPGVRSASRPHPCGRGLLQTGHSVPLVPGKQLMWIFTERSL